AAPAAALRKRSMPPEAAAVLFIFGKKRTKQQFLADHGHQLAAPLMIGPQSELQLLLVVLGVEPPQLRQLVDRIFDDLAFDHARMMQPVVEVPDYVRQLADARTRGDAHEQIV